jgi:hypothetical protein
MNFRSFSDKLGEKHKNQRTIKTAQINDAEPFF